MEGTIADDAAAPAGGTDVYAQSTFTADAEGWSVILGYPQGTTQMPAWQADASGFDGGLVIWSTALDESVTSEVFFAAPSAYSGDLSACYGQAFDYELALELGLGSAPEGFYDGPQGLILRGASADLWIPAPVQDSYDDPTIGRVQRVSVTLVETAQCRLSTTGQPPTTAEFQAVLSDVRALLVRLDWYPGIALWKTAMAAVTLYQSTGGGLDPKLQALQQRLQGAITNDQLTLDATTLGTDGAGIVALMQQWLGTSSLTVAGNVTVSASDALLLLTADSLSGTVLGVTETPVVAVFDAATEGLGIQLRFGCGSGWSLDDSFPNLGSTWIGSLAVLADGDDDAAFVLASADGVLHGDEANRQVAMGLNLVASQVTTAGPATALATLITGIGGSLPALGPASSDATGESIALRGDLPAFSLSLPILPTLQFLSPYVQAVGSYATGAVQPTYVGYLEAGADVTVGSSTYTLPLAVQVPSNFIGWRLGLQPGRAIPISDLASFFGQFTGLSLLAQLPQKVQVLSKLQLQAFMVQLNATHDDLSAMWLSLGSIPGDEGDNLWTVIPGTGATPILALSGIAFDLRVDKRQGNYQYSGTIVGTFNLADTLQLQASVALPIGQGPWVLSASSYATLPNLQDFARYLGGQQLADLLPQRLGALTSYRLVDLTFVYDPQASAFQRLALSLAATDTWTIVDNWLAISNVALQASVDNPLGGQAVVLGQVSGTITLGTSVFLDVSVYRAAVADPWRLDVFTEAVVLPSLGDLTQLAQGDVGALLPQTILDNHFTLRNVGLSVDISAGKVETFTFQLDTSDTWPIITDILAVTEAGIFLTLDWTGSQRVTTGSIWGNVSFCSADFWVEATKEADGWTLAVTLQDGSQLTLQNLVTAFNANLWTSISALGVPDVALTQAHITYATATGSYAFGGAIAPTDPGAWSIPIGPTSLSIIGLGAEVTCTRANDGSATDKKVYVTGSFSVGTVNFTVSYLAGDNLTVDCTLVGSEPVPLTQLVDNLCDASARSVTWTSGFTPLDQIQISNAHAQLVLGNQPSFMLYGKVAVDTVSVDALCVIKKIGGTTGANGTAPTPAQWGFALAVRVDANWSLAGFTDQFADFGIDTSTWMVAASSFTDIGFTFPSTFPTPPIAMIQRGLDFYGTFNIGHTLDTIQGVLTVLPQGTITSSQLTVHGLLADPLAQSYLEVALVASADGVPLMGWDTVRLGMFSLRLTAQPAFALHGDFIFQGIKNPDGSVFHLILDLAVSATEVQIVFEQQPNQGAIFTWQSAFGITGLSIALTDLALGIIFEGPLFDGTIGGSVEFTQTTAPANTVMAGVLPSPVVVAAMQACRPLRAQAMPALYGAHVDLDYARAYDPVHILVAMKVSFVIPAEEPVPVPYQLAGHFINFTLPYILKRFADVDIPPILMPIQFPDVQFDFKLPNPLKPGSDQALQFSFSGDLLIFGFAGHIEAEFDETRIHFAASMDPLIFSVDGTTILAITKSQQDQTHGPDINVDSNPPPGQSQISGDFYCDFFDGFVEFSGAILLKVDTTNPAASRFYFTFSGHVGQLAELTLTLTYQDTAYMAVDGGFQLNLTTSDIPGFSTRGYEVAEKVDLSKYQGPHGLGAILMARLAISLDARNPTDPKFSMSIDSYFDLELSSSCHFRLPLSFQMPVNKDSMAQIPAAVTQQLMTNTANIFGALIDSAACYVELLKLGILVLQDALKVAAVLNGIFSTGIDLGAKLLNELAHTAEDVADALWNIFGSHDTQKNTDAMKNAGYDSDQTGPAVKDAADQGGQTYTAQDLVRNQAAAGYSAPQVASGLCVTFTDYQGKPVDAGQLLANPTLTAFNAPQVAAALRAQYASSTPNAEAMVGVLNQIYTGGAALGPQEMANALAPLYPAPDVAKTLRNHYPSDTATAAAMAGYLLPAYQSTSHPLDAPGLAGALAPLYAATDVAPVLHADFGSATATAALLGGILKAAYAGTTTPIDAPTMARALATVFATPADIVTAMQQLYPSDTGTAMAMAGLLIGAYPHMLVGDMAAALANGQYPLADIAAALQHYYHTDVGTPDGMARVLAAQHYTPPQVAPVLKTLFPQQCGTAAAVLGFLQQGFGAGTIDAPTMAAALAKAPFTPVECAPALKPAYPSATTTAAAMAALLIPAFADGTGANTISAATMAQALAAAPYVADGDGGTAKALLTNYASDTQHALDMARLLKQAPYAAAAIGPVVKTDYPAETAHAGDLAGIFAQTPFDAPTTAPVVRTLYPTEVGSAAPMYAVLAAAFTSIDAPTMAQALVAATYAIADVAPVLKQHYASAVPNAQSMYALLVGAYTQPPVPTAAQMASALAASPYPATDAAPVLRHAYPGDAGTAAQLAPLLQQAYTNPAIDLPTMLAALVAATFNAYDMAPAARPLFGAASVENLGSGLAQALQPTAPVSALQLGTALTAAGFAAGDVGKGVLAGLPQTPVGVMAAVLLVAAESTLAPALVAGSQYKAAGDNAAAAAPKVVQAVAGLPEQVLVTALANVFTPPNLDLPTTAAAAVGGFAQPSAPEIAEGLLLAFPATAAGALLTALQGSYQTAGKSLSPADAASAVAAAFQFLGTPVSQNDVAAALVAAYGTQATPAVVAAALAQAFGNAATTSSLLTALQSGFAGTGVLVDARVGADAVQQALQLGPTQADQLAAPLATTFALTRVPNDVGALAIALKTASFSLNATSAALAAYFGSQWTPQAFQIVGSVYTKPAWDTTVAQRVAGSTIQQASVNVYAAYGDTDAALMVQMLAAVYDLTQTAPAIEPMALALKAVVSGGQKVYSLNDASAAMQAQYAPDWTPDDWRQFIAIFNS